MYWVKKGLELLLIWLALRLPGFACIDRHANAKGFHFCDLVLGLPKVSDRHIVQALVFGRSSIKKFMRWFGRSEHRRAV